MEKDDAVTAAGRYAEDLSRNDRLYDFQKRERIERRREDYRIYQQEEITPGDIENILYSAVPKDRNGNLIPMSQRFDISKRDIRYSMLQQNYMDVNTWMMSVNDADLATAQERELVKQYKNLKMSEDVKRLRIKSNQQKLDTLKAKGTLSVYDEQEKKRLEFVLKEAWEKADKIKDELLQITGSEGYAGLMYKQNRLMNDLANGRTVEEVRKTVAALNREIKNVDEEMAKRAEELKKLADSEGVAVARSYFTKTGLKKAAAELKKHWNSLKMILFQKSFLRMD